MADRTIQSTRTFYLYLIRLVFRALVLGYAIFLFVVDPDQLLVSKYFGLVYGFNAIDFFFLVLLIDILSKFFPHAPIAMGSLKQFEEHHLPTQFTFKGGREALIDFVKDAREQAKIAFRETREGVTETAKQLLQDIDFLHVLDYGEENLTAEAELRRDIRKQRLKEILPVIGVWIVLNAVIFLVLYMTGVLSEQVLIIWTLAYFLSDMICVVAWCPFQIFMMKNRCCTTCQIFNWDGIMAVTPLVFLGGPFGWILVGLSVVVLLRWEIAVARHPERFDERTNASLSCQNCKDVLCRLRPPLITETEIDKLRRVYTSKRAKKTGTLTQTKKD